MFLFLRSEDETAVLNLNTMDVKLEEKVVIVDHAPLSICEVTFTGCEEKYLYYMPERHKKAFLSDLETALESVGAKQTCALDMRKYQSDRLPFWIAKEKIPDFEWCGGANNGND